MIQIKKTILTLVALIAVTTGAWAKSPTIYFQQDYTTETVDWSTSTSGRYTPIVENGYLTVNQDQRSNNGATLTCTATQGKVDAGKDFTMTFNVKLGASDNHDATEFNIYDAANSAPILSFAEGSAGATAWKINGGTQTATVSAGGGKSLNELSWIFVQVTSIAGGKTYLTLKDEQNNIIDGFDKTEIPTISVAGGLGKMTFVTSRRLANFAIDNVLVRDVEDDAASTGPEVAWDKTTKTGTFTMPGGNVTLEPEYYPQAALTEAPTAINDVPATTDGAIVKAGTVANIGSTTTAQGTVMYYVSTTALDDDALLALAADQWTADVPTAESLAEGQAYVYYYVRGKDSDTDEENFSDGDILSANALTVTIAAEPTYAVTFADGVNPEPPAEPEWTASPNADVKKGQTVTVTYTGDRKVIGVKAEKKGAAGKHVSEITPDDIFKVIASNGIIYDNIAAAESAGTVAQGLIVYVGSNTENENYNHGLALALNDENNNTQGEAINACNAKNTSTPIVDALWMLPSEGQWNTMFNAAGGDWKLRDCFSSAGGNNMVKDGEYWSSTGDSEWVKYFMFSGYDWEGAWGEIQPDYNYSCNVRACIVF